LIDFHQPEVSVHHGGTNTARFFVASGGLMSYAPEMLD